MIVADLPNREEGCLYSSKCRPLSFRRSERMSGGREAGGPDQRPLGSCTENVGALFLIGLFRQPRRRRLLHL